MPRITVEIVVRAGLGASTGIVALTLRHYQDLAQERYIDRLSSEARDYFERLPKLWPVPPYAPITKNGPSILRDSGENDACKPANEPIDWCQPSGSLRVEHASADLKCEDAKSVLESVIETHARFLEIVASAMRSSDASANRPPTP